MPAPRKPWIARHTIICSIDEVNPHSRLASVKPLAEIANSSRVRSARDRKPDNGIAITSAIRYAVCTHDISLELADRPAWISVSDAETIWMSRIDMNIPNTMMRNANSRRGAIRSDGAAAAFIIEEDAVTSVIVARTIAGGSWPVNRGRHCCQHPWRLRWYRRWRRPTCPRAAGSA